MKWLGSYGFIRADRDEYGIFRNLFVHCSAIRSGVPAVGSRATFTIGEVRKGLVAIGVTFEPPRLDVPVVVASEAAIQALAEKTGVEGAL